jgi:tRNA pseudouridine55 synthase
MNGILNVLKPPGMTSHDVVSYIRKVSGIKKVGHTGTLDPGAAGVLPICIGKSTKLVDYIMSHKKTYICELTLGNITDTFDKYGKFIYEKNKEFNHVNYEVFEKVLQRFKGQITQIPPAYSAIKIDGKRAYELAREGKHVEIPSRTVNIFNIDILKFSLPNILIKIECSKGTYVRSLCYDIGVELGCGAYMSFLLRSQTGNFTLENCCVLDELNRDNIKEYLITPDSALNMKSIYIDEKFSSKILNGNSIKIINKGVYEQNETVKVYISPNTFIAIGYIIDDILYINKLLV